MTSSGARVHRRHGVAAVTLRSGDLEATFVPELNMLGTSLWLGGEEFLALPGGVGRTAVSTPRAAILSRCPIRLSAG